MSNLFNWIIVI